MYSARLIGQSKAASSALVFARLKGCAQSACRGLCLARTNANFLGKAIAFTVVIYAILYVAHNTLKRLSAALALCFVLLLFHI